MTRCVLCGYEFDEASMACHSQCPLATRCAIICCPNCGYQVVDETKSGMVSFIRRIEKALSRWSITSSLKK